MPAWWHGASETEARWQRLLQPKRRGGSAFPGRCTRRGNADRGYRSLESASDAVVVKLTEPTPLSPPRILPARNCAGSASWSPRSNDGASAVLASAVLEVGEAKAGMLGAKSAHHRQEIFPRAIRVTGSPSFFCLCAGPELGADRPRVVHVHFPARLIARLHAAFLSTARQTRARNSAREPRAAAFLLARGVQASSSCRYSRPNERRRARVSVLPPPPDARSTAWCGSPAEPFAWGRINTTRTRRRNTTSASMPFGWTAMRSRTKNSPPSFLTRATSRCAKDHSTRRTIPGRLPKCWSLARRCSSRPKHRSTSATV